MTAEALATEFEVSVRTIYRDADALSAAGIPLYADRGPGGGFQLLDGYRTRLTGLTFREAGALLLAGLSGPATELGLGEAISIAQLKVLAALPASWESELQRVGSCFYLDPAACHAQIAPGLHDLARAVWERRKITIDVVTPTSCATHLVDPLGLVLKRTSWYLVAQADDKTEIYKISDLKFVCVQDQGFQPPAGFSLPDYWNRVAARGQGRSILDDG